MTGPERALLVLGLTALALTMSAIIIATIWGGAA